MSEVQNFLANVESEENSLNEVTDTPSESQPESNQTEESPSSQGESHKENNTENEENIPFHKHPRWKAKQQEIENLKKTVDELLPFREEVERLRQDFSKVSPQETTQIPPWFSALYGENYDAWKIMELKEKEDRLKFKQEVVQEIENRQIEEKKEKDRWNQWIDNQLVNLENEGKKFNRNELLKIIDDYRPIDEKGNWDFNKGYELLQLKKQLENKNGHSQSRKQLASLTTSESSFEENSKNFVTNLDFKGGKRGF